MLAEISKRFRLDGQRPASSADEIAALRSASPVELPDDYVALIQEGTELEFAIDNRDYIRIWGASGCVEMNQAYDIGTSIPSSLAVGDNEGGAALIHVTKVDRPGIYLVSFGCLDIEEAKFIAPSLRALLIDEVGIEIFT